MFRKMFLRQSNAGKGFSLIEVLLSISIFAMFVTGLIGAVIYGRESTMLSGARSRAVFLAEEGLEAARNIRDESFVNLVDGTYGLAVTSNQWQFSGSSDTTDSFFTRQIVVSTVDSTKKQIASTITWQQNPQRTGSVTLTNYLTKWQAQRGGIAVYSDTTQTPQDQFRIYNNVANTFNSQSAMSGASINGRNFVIKTSPIKTEAIAGFTNPTSPATLQIMCYNGSSWTSEWTATVGGTGTTKRFDIAYETNSGDVVVLYSTNAATSELASRTKPGNKGCGTGNWSNAVSFESTRTTGIVQWVKMASDKRLSSNLITAAWADANSDLSAAVWDGSTWTNQPLAVIEASLEVASAAQDVDSFDVDYESVTGNAMIVWSTLGSGATGLLKYKNCTGGTASCSWGTNTNILTVADAGTNLDISANPNTNEIVMAAFDNGSADLSLAYWSGSAWTGTANADTTTATSLAGTKLLATGWLISGGTTRSVVVYNNSATTNIHGFTGNANVFTRMGGADPTAWFSPTPAFGNPQKWYGIQMDPFNKDTLILLVSDVNNDLTVNRLVMTSVPAFTWSSANSNNALQTNLGQATTGPFDFAYWRDP